MKFLYSLLFIFIFVSSSYCSTTMGDTTCDVNSPFNKIEQSLNQDLGCVNPSYYKEGTIYSCSPSAINEQEQHFVSGYCSSYGYQKMVRNTWSYLETSSCPEGEVPNSDGVCSAPECTPLSDIPLSLTQSQCENGAFYSDYNTGLQGQLGWNDCDSTCYLLEAQYMSCEQLGSYYQSSCDTSKNNFNFSCTATNGVPQIDTENTWCKPKSNPCDDLFQRVEATCTDNQVITGYDECRHDGINVLNPEVIKCVDNNSSENPAHQKPWDCTSYFHKSWDDSSKTCSCSSGYELSLYGSCKKSLDTNATQAEKDSADKLAKDDALNKDKMENDRNSSIGERLKFRVSHFK